MKLKMRLHQKIHSLKSRLWFNVFLQVAVIFIIFALVLMLCNTALLSRFFTLRQKNLLVSQIKRLDGIQITDTSAVSELLTDISDNHNFDTEIYDGRGNIYYTTHGAQMMDFIMGNNPAGFNMSHETLVTIRRQKLADGIVYEEAIDRFQNQEFLLCRKQISDNLYAEVRIQKALITSSAKTANEFITVVSLFCLMISMVWVVFFAKRFSRPLTNMNEITRDMASLKFDRRLAVDRTDEIGQLAVSINEMSASLSATLEDLKQSNSRLRDEIELERSLDSMRRQFVANVSHELKTPLSIISGYAEGLKLNVNGENREKYCDTIIDESARMNALVLSILELSRYESGQIPLSLESFDIACLSAETANRIFEKSGIHIAVSIPENTLVFADKMQITQVLKAYLENAKSHTEKGGTVTVSAKSKEDKFVISVHNEGAPISEEIMPQIWQSFYRGDSSHKRDQSRFGLGLSIVNAIMKMHKSACGVYNTESGVCFWFDVQKSEQ